MGAVSHRAKSLVNNEKIEKSDAALDGMPCHFVSHRQKLLLQIKFGHGVLIELIKEIM
jgi:hypothetical protein